MANSHEPKLNCPFCGSNSLSSVKDHPLASFTFCRECGASALSGIWNRREEERLHALSISESVQAALNAPVKDLMFSARASSVLSDYEIITQGDLVEFIIEQGGSKGLQQIYGVGEVAAGEIYDAAFGSLLKSVGFDVEDKFLQNRDIAVHYKKRKRPKYLDELGLSTRAIFALCDAGIGTQDELNDFVDANGLKAIRGLPKVGDKLYKEICYAYKKATSSDSATS